MAFVFLVMLKKIVIVSTLGIMLQSCIKKECTIRNPFTSSEIANYKCKSNCKTDAEILSNVQCIRCISQMLDTVETCNRADGDSLILFYQNHPLAGHCDKVDAKLECDN